MKPVISTIKDIYPASQAESQKQRYKAAVAAFAEHFGSVGEHRFFSAPGRTEICGNHTDHNHGKVFAASVNLDVIAVVEPTDDGMIVIKSEGFPEDSIDISTLDVVESEKNYLLFYREKDTRDEAIRVRMKMSEAEKKLEAHKFVRTHKGYLVNMNYVYRLREKELLLLNGKSIPVSRNYLNQVRMKIMGVVME